jgi:hypothetical protein
MEAASTFETSVNSYQTTRRNNPEDSHLHYKNIVRRILLKLTAPTKFRVEALDLN